MNKLVNESLEKYFLYYKPVVYQKNKTIVYSTDEPSGIYFIEEGYVKMGTMSIDGNELVLNILKPGSYFPVFWAIGEQNNSYSFEAITKVRLRKSPKENFLVFLKNNPEVLYNLTKRVFSGVDRLLSNMTNLLVGRSESRIASAILLISERFGEKKADIMIVNLSLTHENIASMAGMTRETASIAIGNLVKNKIIKQEGRKIVILDIKKLRQKSGQEF